LAQSLRQVRSRVRRGHLVALSAVVAAAFGLAGLRAIDLPGPRPVVDGERLRIEVVQPIEPDIVPGTRMDVGELVEGFQGVPPPAPSVTDRAIAYAASWVEDLPPLPPPPRRRPVVEEAAVRPEVAENPRPDRAEGRWFGFDAPRRDYQAERAARRARLEALDRQAWEERQARRREWARSRQEARRREDWNDDWREARRDVPPWRPAPPRDAYRDRGSFTGPE
jgi:hypothetical protein